MLVKALRYLLLVNLFAQWVHASFDVVIVSHYKDYEILPSCIASIKHYIPGHRRIFVIGNRAITGSDFIYIAEAEFYKYITPLDIKNMWHMYNPRLEKRAFWIFQQLLKLGAHLLIDDLSDNYLCIDSDIIWTRKQQFMNEKGQFFYAKHKACACCPNSLIHSEYVMVTQRLLRNKAKKIPQFSFIAHHMMFNKKIVKTMLAYIEKVHKQPWYSAITFQLNLSQGSNFSEYELYGTWLWNNYYKLLAYRHMQWVRACDIAGISDLTEYDFISAQYYESHSHDMGYPIEDKKEE